MMETVGTMSYYGGYVSATTENIEPLGQKIHPHDPADYSGPPPGSTILGNADDPEWQCTLPESYYGNFVHAPIHCGDRYYISYETVYPDRESDPKKIAFAFPHEIVNARASAIGDRYAVATTAKDKGGDTGGCKEGEVEVEDPVTHKKRCVKRPTATVEVNAGKDSSKVDPTLFVPTLMKDGDLVKIRSALVDLINPERPKGRLCDQFLKNTLNALGQSQSESIIELFDKIKEDGGVYERSFRPGEEEHGEGTNIIGSAPPIVVYGRGLANDLSSEMEMVIHEIFHVAGKQALFRHFDMAQAAIKAGKAVGIPEARFLKDLQDPRAPNLTYEDGQLADAAASGRFTTLFHKACDP